MLTITFGKRLNITFCNSQTLHLVKDWIFQLETCWTLHLAKDWTLHLDTCWTLHFAHKKLLNWTELQITEYYILKSIPPLPHCNILHLVLKGEKHKFDKKLQRLNLSGCLHLHPSPKNCCQCCNFILAAVQCPLWEQGTIKLVAKFLRNDSTLTFNCWEREWNCLNTNDISGIDEIHTVWK